MRTFCTFFVPFLLVFPSFGQTNGASPDTLLLHTFEGILDPADSMLNIPTGYDQHWVNYDQDNKTAHCVEIGTTPKGWYWESDLGVPAPTISDNDVLTSCSFLSNANFRNRNWLITSPVYIPDDSYWLCWKSLSYYGPDIMDGYHVLASKTSNLPDSFKDTLYSVAETEIAIVHYSLDLSDYIFSEGYIHANGYTDTNYFFIDYENNTPFYHGKLEPHCVNLSQYAGELVYLAFLHDSKDDAQLQIDDILVTNTLVSTFTPANFLSFNILPNPVQDFAYVNWRTEKAQSGRLSLVNAAGKIVFEQNFNARLEGQIQLDLQGYPAGVYFCKLESDSGQATKMLVKI
ncbi:MAG: T9SS type A sorting domain-containing protein [Saprospiraceae bacterium]